MTGDDGSPLVSVVMIFRDAQAYFDQAIASVMAQEHRPLELLLCDDGSSDASTATARRWAAQHPAEIRYLEHPGHAHRGMSATRNLGITAARGDIVAFLDADDVWSPEHLRRQVALLVEHPEVGLACGSAVEWRSWQDPPGEDVPTPLPWPPGTVVAPPRMLEVYLRRGAFRIPTCSLTVRREALRQAGGAEESFTSQFEDQALLAKLHLSYASVISGGRTAWYRRHAASSTARAAQAGIYDPGVPNVSHETYLRWLQALPQVQALPPDGELRAALAAALAPYGDGRRRGPSPAALALLVKRRTTEEQRRLLRGAARRLRRRGPPGLGLLRWTEPLSRQFGFDRGLPVDRHYIEAFLQQNAHLVAGRVLEVGDDAYTRRFGGDRVGAAEVLNVDQGVPGTTYVGDLADAPQVPSGAFDCVVLTQTLHLVYDMPAAVRTLHRVLRPGGTALVTVPGISQLADDRWAETWYWSLTPLAARRLFGDVFGADHVEVESRGNVAAAVAFLEGVAAHELRPRALAYVDPHYPVLVTIRASKPAGSSAERGSAAG